MRQATNILGAPLLLYFTQNNNSICPVTDHILVVGLERAASDLQEFGVPPQPLHLVLIAVPVSTKNLKKVTTFT